MRRILALLVVVALVSGCLASPDDAPPGGPKGSQDPIPSLSPDPTSILGDNHTLINNTGELTNWTAFQYKGEGKANSWLLVYQPLPQPVQRINWSYFIDVTVRVPAGSAGGAVLALPGPLIDSGQGPQFNTSRLFTLYDADGGDMRFQWVTPHFKPESEDLTGKPGASLPGFFFALLTSGEWTLQVQLQLGALQQNEVPPVEPQFIARGGNVTFLAPGAHAAGTLPLVSDHATLTQTNSESGWSHLQLTGEAPHLESYDIRFPDDSVHQQSNAVPRFSTFGTLQDEAEEFSATVDAIHGENEPRDLVFFHAPLTPSDFPPKFHFVSYEATPWAPGL